MLEVGTRIIHGRPYHPQSQGVIEVGNKLLKKAMRHERLKRMETGEEGDDWAKILAAATLVLNTVAPSSTGQTPEYYFNAHNSLPRVPKPLRAGEPVTISLLRAQELGLIRTSESLHPPRPVATSQSPDPNQSSSGLTIFPDTPSSRPDHPDESLSPSSAEDNDKETAVASDPKLCEMDCLPVGARRVFTESGWDRLGSDLRKKLRRWGTSPRRLWTCSSMAGDQ